MTKIALLVCLCFVSTAALATIDCEKKLSAYFKTLDIGNINKSSKKSDYLHPAHSKLAKCVYTTKSEADFKKFMELGKSYEVKDSYKNEIIRVCTAISAFVSLDMPADKIYEKLGEFESGWSTAMTEPLKKIIADEIAAKSSPSPCADSSQHDGGREASSDKTEAGKVSAPAVSPNTSKQ